MMDFYSNRLMTIASAGEPLGGGLPSPNSSCEFPTVVITPTKTLHNSIEADGNLPETTSTNVNDVITDSDNKLPLLTNGGPEELTSLLATVVHDSSSRKLLSDKPRRPLSAYNIFFQLQRERILNNDADSSDTTTGFTEEDCKRIVSNISRQRISSSEGNGSGGSNVDPAAAAAAALKRKHRKSHGKIGFADLARTIAAKWKIVDPELKERFEKYSTMDKKRYRLDIEAYNKYMMLLEASLARTNTSMNKVGDKTNENVVSIATEDPPLQSKVLAKHLSSSFGSSSNHAALTPSLPMTNLSTDGNRSKEGNMFTDTVPSSYFGQTNIRSGKTLSHDEKKITQDHFVLSQSQDHFQPWTGQQFEHPAHRRLSMPSLAYNSSNLPSYSPSQQTMTSSQNTTQSYGKFSRRHSSATFSTAEIEKDNLDDILMAKMRSRASFNSLENIGMGNSIEGRRIGHFHASSGNTVAAIRQHKQYMQMKNRSNSMNRLLSSTSQMSNHNEFSEAYNLADETYFMAHEMLPNRQGHSSSSDTLKKRHTQPNFVMSGTTSDDGSNLLSIQQQQHLLLQRKQRQRMQNQQHELRRLQQRRQFVRMQRELQHEREMMSLGIHPNELIEQDMMGMSDDVNFHDDEKMISNSAEDTLIKEILQQEQIRRQAEKITNMNGQSIGLSYDDDDDVDEEVELGMTSSDFDGQQLQFDGRVQQNAFDDQMVEEQRLQQMYMQLRQEEEIHLRRIHSSNHCDDDPIPLVGSNTCNNTVSGAHGVSSNVSIGDTHLGFDSNCDFSVRDGDPGLLDFGPFLTTKAPN